MEDINQQLSNYVSKCQPVLTQARSMCITYSSSVIPKTGFVKIAYSEEYLFIMAHLIQKLYGGSAASLQQKRQLTPAF